MNSHKNAPLTPEGRYRMVRRIIAGETLAEVAVDFDVSVRTASKWLGRYRLEGRAGLVDRSSRPHRSHPRALSPSTLRRIVVLRRKRLPMNEIAARTGVSMASVARHLRPDGLNRLSALDPPMPVQRYERRSAGDLIHMDIKKLVRFQRPGHRVTQDRRNKSVGAGFEFVHVCIDDHSRISYAEVLADERKETVIGFWKRARAYYQFLGIHVRELMTDNGSAYRSKLFNRVLDAMEIKHRFTRPYTPRTNGKAERFIQTLIREWAYARSYRSSVERQRRLNPWLHRYNWHRPHGGIGYHSPMSRIAPGMNNLLSIHT